jgi:hypothetical protein
MWQTYYMVALELLLVRNKGNFSSSWLLGAVQLNTS